MIPWSVLAWALAIVAGPLALYRLHRLGLWLEERGYVYYWHRQPKGGAASCFVALQKAVEPQVQHVLQVEREKNPRGEEGAGE